MNKEATKKIKNLGKIGGMSVELYMHLILDVAEYLKLCMTCGCMEHSCRTVLTSQVEVSK